MTSFRGRGLTKKTERDAEERRGLKTSILSNVICEHTFYFKCLNYIYNKYNSNKYNDINSIYYLILTRYTQFNSCVAAKYNFGYTHGEETIITVFP